MDLYDQILNSPMPLIVRSDLRRESRKVRAQAVRDLFKRMGFKGISVTTPMYSMAQSIDIKVKKPPCAYTIHHDCPDCLRVGQAQRRLGQIVLAAFPDLDDRSDSRSDHFDYCFSIN